MNPPVVLGRRISKGTWAMHRTAGCRPDQRHIDLLEAKFGLPTLRPGTVSRPGLVNRLRAATAAPVVALVAPAGYGKTTLLAQWAMRDQRPVAWVTLDEEDDDPISLLRYVATALDRIEPLAPDLLAADSSAWLWPSALPWLTAAVHALSRPVLLVLDDVHLVRDRDAARALTQLARHIPPGSTLVLSGRMLPRLPTVRLRAGGLLVELGPGDLALGRREARLLMTGAGVSLDERAVDELIERTEGWPAGLYLAARSIAAGGDPASFSGEDRSVAEYVRLEQLSDFSPADLRFLTRSSVLETMSGRLCDAVLGVTGSAQTLEWLTTRSIAVPLDRNRQRYRYHRLVRDVLRAELQIREPGRVRSLNARAAAWCEANDAREAAVGYAAAAGDVDAVARHVGRVALPAYHDGRVATVESWLDRVQAGGPLGRWTDVAALGAWIHAVRGRPEEAEGWLAAAERGDHEGPLPDGTSTIAPWLALLRATLAATGCVQMLADAEAAERELAPASQWRPYANLLVGVARMLLGEPDAADAAFTIAAEAAERLRATDTRILALSERSLLAGASGDDGRARALAGEARALAEARPQDGYSTCAIQLAASALVELKNGNAERVRADLDNADLLRPRLTYAVPWLSVQTLLELARARMGLLDLVGARSLVADADAIVRRRPELGTLAARARVLRADLAELAQTHDRRRLALTAAELRLVPLLATHLSFREIGERLHISRNTVKTQAIAVYRKLGVSSRSDAIELAATLGVVRPTVPEDDRITLPG